MSLQDCNQLNDEQWVVRALKNPDDFFCLVIKYEPLLLRYIRRISGISDEASQDIVQEVFIKAYRHLNDFDPALKFSSWIYRIAHNHTLNEVAKNRKFIFCQEEELVDRLVRDLFEGTSLEQEAIASLTQKILTDCIESLNDRQKAVILLYFWEEKSYEEISDILHLPMGTVGTYLSRGKEKIKACLERVL